MPFAKVFSGQTSGLSAHIVDVEVDISRGLNNFSLVGLPDKAVAEAKDRVSAAIKNSGFTSPKQQNQKVVVSLAPAELKKEGPVFDLAVALGYLLANEEIRFDPTARLFIGELSLDGNLRPIRGMLAIAKRAKEKSFKEIFVPKENAEEAALIEGIRVFGAETLKQVLSHLREEEILEAQPKTEISFENLSENLIDFADIRGQESAKRALEIAAAGNHNVVMHGPAGTGKTMLARAFSGILPNLTHEEILEVTAIHSIAGALENNLVIAPPFRAPHHTSSYVSLIGGGTIPRPGEVTLAHRGVLFLDELPEFERRVIDSLRQPLEDRVVTVSRAKGTAQFPANFVLIAAMNPPKEVVGEEYVSEIMQSRFRKKISNPIIDRIDLWTEVGKVSHEKLSEAPSGEKTAEIKRRVEAARKRQRERFSRHPKIRSNNDMRTRDLDIFAPLDEASRALLNKSAENLDLSARAYHRIIKVARTIADLSGAENISSGHILEAIQYRPKENLFG